MYMPRLTKLFRLKLLLAPCVPWFLALMFEVWPSGSDPHLEKALASLAHTCAYFGLGMFVANLLWAQVLTTDTCVPLSTSKEPS